MPHPMPHPGEPDRTDDGGQQGDGSSGAAVDRAAVGMAHVGADGRWLRVNPAIPGGDTP